MVPGIDPKVDFAFKKIFGSEGNAPLLIDLLHAVLNPPPEERIVSLEILNPFNDKDTLDDKQSILDIRVRDARGTLYNVEMQMAGSLAFPERLLYYWAAVYGKQLHEGDEFTELRATISVCFLNDVLFPQVPDHHLHFQLRCQEHPELIFSRQQSMHLLELPKFRRGAEELTNALDVWLYFLRHGDELDRDQLPAALRVPPVAKAMEVLAMVTQDEREQAQYLSRKMFELDQRTRDKFAREAHEIGHEKGRQEGLQEGRKEGRQEGLQEGQVIGRIHSYQRMLKQPLTTTEELSGLSLADLTASAEALEKQLGVA